jgi:hypothetical protein
MSNQVYANNMAVSCKAAAGKSICAFPDVCMTPPQTPATPPGVPIPYPNTGLASDTSDGSTSVNISGQEVMLKNKSYFKKSTGDEAGCAPMKGVITHTNMGKVYFNAWSMDVKVEGENVVRMMDMTTHNHGSSPGQTPPYPYMDKMFKSTVGSGVTCKEVLKNECIDIHSHGRAECPSKHDSDHIVQNACFENSRGTGGITSAPNYDMNMAPCVCLKGPSSKPKTAHYKKTQGQNYLTKKWKGKKSVSYKTARDGNLAALENSMDPKPSKDAMECIKRAVNNYFKDELGLKEDEQVRVPRSGKFRRPAKKGR